MTERHRKDAHWHEYRVADDDRTIELVYSCGTSWRPDRAELSEVDDAVRIVLVGTEPSPARRALRVGLTARVVLPFALAGRRVVNVEGDGRHDDRPPRGDAQPVDAVLVNA